MNWLKDTWALKEANLFPCLLYRALWNGWAASNFHSCCDNKGPTVTVIKSGTYIFGAYTEQPWEGRSHFDVPGVLILLTVQYLLPAKFFSKLLAKKVKLLSLQVSRTEVTGFIQVKILVERKLLEFDHTREEKAKYFFSRTDFACFLIFNF